MAQQSQASATSTSGVSVLGPTCTLESNEGLKTNYPSAPRDSALTGLVRISAMSTLKILMFKDMFKYMALTSVIIKGWKEF